MNYLQSMGSLIKSTKVGNFAVRNASKILFGVGIVSSVGTVASTISSTKRSIDILNAEKERRREAGLDETITLKEKFKLCWKEWLVTVGSFAVSTASYAGAYKMEADKAITFAAALGSAESRLAILEKEMMEKLGEEKTEEIHKAVAQEIINEKVVGPEATEETERTILDDGYDLCFDPITEQPEWRTTKDKIELSLERCNRELEKNKLYDSSYDQVCLNDFLVGAGGKETNIGRHLVWDASKVDEIKISVMGGITRNGRSCLVLEYRTPPTWEDAYDAFH